MSKKLLMDLNGNKAGQFKEFLDQFERDPRIAWYPSAGSDFRGLLYLHPNYSQLFPASEQEPQPPDIFLFTDYDPWSYSLPLRQGTIFSDGRTTVRIDHIEELAELSLPLHEEVVNFINRNPLTDTVLFLIIRINSNMLGSYTYPVIYARAENESFYCYKLAPNNAKISHIIHVRYGGGLGGGGKASGVWLLHVLKKLNCEVFITDGKHHWQSGDKFFLKFCSSIPREKDVRLKPIRIIPEKSWSNHGDVSWNLVL